jgi:hypothetical protein
MEKLQKDRDMFLNWIKVEEKRLRVLKKDDSFMLLPPMTNTQSRFLDFILEHKEHIPNIGIVNNIFELVVKYIKSNGHNCSKPKEYTNGKNKI